MGDLPTGLQRMCDTERCQTIAGPPLRAEGGDMMRSERSASLLPPVGRGGEGGGGDGTHVQKGCTTHGKESVTNYLPASPAAFFAAFTRAAFSRASFAAFTWAASSRAAFCASVSLGTVKSNGSEAVLEADLESVLEAHRPMIAGGWEGTWEGVRW